MGHQFDDLSGRVIRAAIAVHRELGPGFLETIYENALKTALCHRGMTYETQKEVTVFFEGEEAGSHRLDLVVERELVIELKAVKALEDIHFAQVKSYLKATGLRVGLLLNFNAPTLIVKRVVLHFKPTQPATE
ncbi:MAG: GxxExxY protein [Thermoguttaceae bacterium]